MIKPVNTLLGFAKATTTQILAALNGLAGNFGYDFTQKRFFGTHDDGQPARYFATLDDLASVSVPDASDTVKGAVEMADATEFAAGTDIGLTGAALAVTPSQVKTALDLRVQIAEDLTNTPDAPRVASSTTADARFVVQSIGAAISKAIKATATALQIRTADDTAFASLEADGATFAGDVVFNGNVTFNGTNTTVDSTNSTVKDNVIVLNNGEVGSAVTAGVSGLEIDRGLGVDAEFVFAEATNGFEAGFAGNRAPIARTRKIAVATAAANTHILAHGLDSIITSVTCFDTATGVEFGVAVQAIDANTVQVGGIQPFTNFTALVVA